MSHEDSTPQTLNSQGWEDLRDGRQQLLLQCNTVVDYATLPKGLRLGGVDMFKAGWDSDRKVAFYRSGETEDLLGAPTTIVME